MVAAWDVEGGGIEGCARSSSVGVGGRDEVGAAVDLRQKSAGGGGRSDEGLKGRIRLCRNVGVGVDFGGRMQLRQKRRWWQCRLGANAAKARGRGWGWGRECACSWRAWGEEGGGGGVRKAAGRAQPKA